MGCLCGGSAIGRTTPVIYNRRPYESGQTKIRQSLGQTVKSETDAGEKGKDSEEAEPQADYRAGSGSAVSCWYCIGETLHIRAIVSMKMSTSLRLLNL
jgi:hypothetical protein